MSAAETRGEPYLSVWLMSPDRFVPGRWLPSAQRGFRLFAHEVRALFPAMERAFHRATEADTVDGKV
jgi:hypothetical protein